jgi:hypothetical protein
LPEIAVVHGAIVSRSDDRVGPCGQDPARRFPA